MRLRLAILRASSLLVPSAHRAEWFAEWSAELCYVSHGSTRFCLGSFRDALWLRTHFAASHARPSRGLESPARCLLLLAVIAAATLFFALRIRLLNDTLLPSAYVDTRNLATIHTPGRSGRMYPTVTLAQYRALLKVAHDQFRDVAFYRPAIKRVQTTRRGVASLSIAEASANLFQVLETPIATAGPHTLILSHAAWTRYFGRDRHIVGRPVDVGGQSLVVGGVLQTSLGSLPGLPDAWMLEDAGHFDALPPEGRGFVLGRVRLAAICPQPALPWTIPVPNAEGGYIRLECQSLSSGQAALRYLVLALVSLLVLSAVTPLALGSYPRNRYSPTGVTRQRRWIFFAIKLTLLVAAVYYGSFDLGYLAGMSGEPFTLMVGLIVGLRWALVDQRQRCPVCLRRLTGPTRIGGASRMLLEWYGTELVCSRGHGLLYVPEIPTSCYSTQRWQDLDPSWSSLFS